MMTPEPSPISPQTSGQQSHRWRRRTSPPGRVPLTLPSKQATEPSTNEGCSERKGLK